MWSGKQTNTSVWCTLRSNYTEQTNKPDEDDQSVKINKQTNNPSVEASKWYINKQKPVLVNKQQLLSKVVT